MYQNNFIKTIKIQNDRICKLANSCQDEPSSEKEDCQDHQNTIENFIDNENVLNSNASLKVS